MILQSLRQHLSAANHCVLAARRRERTLAIPAGAIETALVNLPEPSRTVYLLHARDQLSLSDVARQLDLTPSDVERHLAFALIHLDRQIGTVSPEGVVASGSTER